MKNAIYLTALFFITIVWGCKPNNTITPPLTPSGLNATAISTSAIKLQWTDNSTNEKGFKIERKTGSEIYSVIATTSINTTTFKDSGLITSNSYTYRVYAFNEGGNSISYSNEVTIATLPGCTYTTGTTVASSSEKSAIQTYLSTNSLTATELDNSGLYYIITNSGNSNKPSSQCSTVTVKYIAQLATGKVFDQTTGSNTSSFILGALIEGWRRGLPLIGEGGRIKLIIPPSMAYGANGIYNSNTGVYTIPPNSIVIFDVELVSAVN